MNGRDPFRSDAQEGRAGEPGFLRRVLITVSVVAVAAGGMLLLWQAADVLLLLFAGVLLAVVLRGAADWVGRLTRLSPGWSLAAVLVLLLAAATATGWFLGAEIAGEFGRLSRALTASAQQVEADLRKSGWWPDSEDAQSVGGFLLRRGNVFQQITGAVSAVLGLAANVLVVLVVAVFVAAQPDRYRAGVLHLVPFRHRERAGEVLDTVGQTLRWWMGGQLLDMLLVGALTGVGLYFLGSPVPLALGILTGLIVFIPYIGPLLSALPAVLIALPQGPGAAVNVALLYLVIQLVESNLIQPFIQDRSVDLPPAVVIGAQLLMGVLLGILGVMFATPLVAAIMVTVKLLYVQDTLGDPVEVKGEPDASPQGADGAAAR